MFNQPQNSKLFSSATADIYLQRVQEFCEFIREHEGILVTACDSSQVELISKCLNKIDEPRLQYKLSHFNYFFEFCRDVIAKGQSLREKENNFKLFLSRLNLIVPDLSSVVDQMGQDTFVEIYDDQFTQIYRCIDFLEITNHSLMALECCEWYELFYRSEKYLHSQIEYMNSFREGQRLDPAFDPIEDHTVKEINSREPLSSQMKALCYAPIFDHDNVFQGVVHVFKVINARSLKFQVIKNSK